LLGEKSVRYRNKQIIQNRTPAADTRYDQNVGLSIAMTIQFLPRPEKISFLSRCLFLPLSAGSTKVPTQFLSLATADQSAEKKSKS
jgi:hypothetical protein